MINFAPQFCNEYINTIVNQITNVRLQVKDTLYFSVACAVSNFVNS